jgi:hypothetical protein
VIDDQFGIDFIDRFTCLGHVLNEFVQHAALPYLENDSPDVRQTAALTCARLFIRDPICQQTSTHSIEIISDVLDKLLTVAIADPGKHRWQLESSRNLIGIRGCRSPHTAERTSVPR